MSDCACNAMRELGKIDEILRSYGYEYPPGMRGVADLALRCAGYLDTLHAIDPEHYRAAVRPSGTVSTW